jgi:hypothetical protein
MSVESPSYSAEKTPLRVCVYTVCTNFYDSAFLPTLLPASPLAAHVLFVDKVSIRFIVREKIYIHPSYEIVCIAAHLLDDYLLRFDLPAILGRVPTDRICKFLPMSLYPDYDIYLYHDLRVAISEPAFNYSIRLLSVGYDRVGIPHRKSHTLKNELSHCLARCKIGPAQLTSYLSLLRAVFSSVSVRNSLSLPVTENGFFAFCNNTINFQFSSLILNSMSLSSVSRDQLLVPLACARLPVSISIYPFVYNSSLGCRLAYRSQSIHPLHRLIDSILNFLRTQAWSYVISLYLFFLFFSKWLSFGLLSVLFIFLHSYHTCSRA